MFVGHYAAAFVLKAREPKASLALLFLATQFVDILFFPFVLLGLEHLEIVPGYTEANSFKMDHYPFTHGLLGSLLWSVIVFALVYFIMFKKRANAKSIAMVMALGVLSHWFFDLIVHTPDLPLVTGAPKFGFGLWNHVGLTFLTETFLLILGLMYYLKQSKPLYKSGQLVPYIFTVFLVAIGYLNLFVLPESDNVTSLTISALSSYFLLAFLAYLVERLRR